MKSPVILVALLFFTSSCAWAAEPSTVQVVDPNPQAKTGQAPTYLPGEVLVQVEEGAPLEQVEGIAQAVGAKVERPVASWGLYLFRFDPQVQVEEIIQRLEGQPGVVYAEPNYEVEVFFHQWDGDNPAQASAGGTPVVVAVIDTGLDFSHPAFSGHLYTNPNEIAGDGIDNDGNGYVDDVHGYDFYSRDADPSGGPGDGAHGTQVAGRALQGAINAAVQIMTLRVGPGPSLSLAAIIEAIDYAVRNGARMINMSFGTAYNFRSLQNAVKRASNAGLLQVAAAGNSGTQQKSYPAGYDQVTAVASSNAAGRKSAWSNYGKWVDFTATGENVSTTTWGGGTATVSGTSFSSPFLAGVAARILAASPGLTNKQVLDRIATLSKDVNALNPLYVGKLGRGLVDQEVAQRVADTYPFEATALSEPKTTEESQQADQTRAARRAQIQQLISRLEGRLRGTEEALSGISRFLRQAEQELQGAQWQFSLSIRQWQEAWRAWVRTLVSGQPGQWEGVSLRGRLIAAAEAYWKAHLQVREAAAQLRAAQAQDRAIRSLQSEVQSELRLLQLELEQLNRQSPVPQQPGAVPPAHRAQVQAGLLQRRAVLEALERGALPEDLQASERGAMALADSLGGVYTLD